MKLSKYIMTDANDQMQPKGSGMTGEHNSTILNINQLSLKILSFVLREWKSISPRVH